MLERFGAPDDSRIEGDRVGGGEVFVYGSPDMVAAPSECVMRRLPNKVGGGRGGNIYYCRKQEGGGLRTQVALGKQDCHQTVTH